MGKASTKDRTGARVARHRVKAAANGSRRLEVTVPAQDAPLVKAVAGALRSGGAEAKRVRKALKPLVSPEQARTGAELVAFLRASPVAGAELTFERDPSSGRIVEFAADDPESTDRE